MRKAVWLSGLGTGKKMYVAVKCFFADKAGGKGGFVEEVSL